MLSVIAKPKLYPEVFWVSLGTLEMTPSTLEIPGVITTAQQGGNLGTDF